MKKFIGLALAASAIGATAYACDVCGGAASVSNLGILPKASQHFIALQYQHNSFRSDHPSIFESRPNERSSDYYNTLQLWGRYNAGRRLQLYAFLPYRQNRQQTDTATYGSSGVGDVSVLVNAVLVKDDPGSDSWQSQWLAGGGMKAPTGAYAGISERDKLGLPNMQPGTASWDFSLTSNYTLRHRRNGINLDASYTFTLPNADRYKYGNRLNAGLLLFRTYRHKGFTLLPQAGVRGEYSLHDYDNYDRRWLNRQSGGYMCFAAAGFQSYYKRLGMRLLWQLPIAQHYAQGYVRSTQRIEAGLFLLF